jgi:hypothetical protein
MHYWERTQRRYTNVLVALAAVGLIGLAIVFFRSPQTIDRFVDNITRRTKEAPVVAAPAQAEQPAEKPVVKKGARQRRLNSRASDSSEADSATQPQPKELPRVELRTQAELTEASVKIDDVAVYASNSPASSVVHRLKKGDKVESNLEVVDARGRWSLVETTGLKRTGFVRSEDLEREKNREAHP